MEQEREEPQQQQEQPPSTALKCPRCHSLDTKFRYFNNNSLAQPRHYCKNCKRLWTVGGNLREIPIGGKPRNGKPTKASTSGGGNPRSQPTQPRLSLGEEHQQNLQSPTIQPFTNLPAAVSSLDAYYFNDEISCLDAIQSLIQPEINNPHVNAGNHFIGAGANMTIQQEWNVQTMALQQAIPQGIPRNFESHQTHNEAINAPPSNMYRYSAVQPSCPINSLAQDITNDSSFTTSNACLWNNFSGDATNAEDTTSVNVDEWLNFSDNDPS